MTRKILCLVLALSMTLGLVLTGCSGSGSQTTTAATTAAAGTTAAATEATTAAGAATAAETTAAASEDSAYPLSPEPIYYTAMNAVTSQNSTGKWDDLNYFTRVGELTNVYFEFTNIPDSDYSTKMNLSLASGILNDVYLSGVYADNIRTYGVEGGMFLVLNDLIASSMPELAARNEEDPRMLKVVTETDGNIYSFPQFVETATIAMATLYTRLDYTEKVGYDKEKVNAIQGISEVYDLMKLVQADNVDNPDFVTLLPYSSAYGMEVLEDYFFPAFGDDPYSGYVENGDGTIHENYTSDQMRRYLSFMNQLFSEKILYNEVYTADTATTTAITKANNSAFMSYATMLTYENFESGNLDMVLMPLVTSEYTDTRKCIGYAGVADSTRVISASCEQPEILCRFLDINYAKDDVAPGINGLTNWLGVRGECWDYTDDTHQFYSVIIPDGVELSATEVISSFYGPSIHSYCSLMAIQQGASPGLTCKGLESLEKLYPYHVAPFPSSYLKYSSEESERLTTLSTEITEYISSMEAKFISGAESFDSWDEYVATLDKMNLSEMTSIMQDAYTRYNG